MVIVASIFVMLAVTLIPAVRSTLNQRSEISELSEQLAQQRERVSALQQEQRRWSDPAYIEQQARERLKFVRVGERSYTVIDADVAPDGGVPNVVTSAGAFEANSPWYTRMWQSMVVADTTAGVPADSRPSPAPPSP